MHRQIRKLKLAHENNSKNHGGGRPGIHDRAHWAQLEHEGRHPRGSTMQESANKFPCRYDPA
jgi:hypothetical protein